MRYMDYAEFADLVESTIRGMYDRIPERFHEDFEHMFIAGEEGLAVDTLVGGLARFDIPVTPSERENLAALLRDMNEPESRLDNIRVTPEPQGQSEP